jgi:glycosyltransferase involved in cell wall biosynthesis
MNKISIITVVKNGMPYLDDCLKSFQLQNYPNKEQIVICSKSEDFTIDYLKNYKKKNVKIFFDNKSTNKFEALNIGINNCSGDIIGILHADDIFYSKDTLNYISKNFPKNDIVYGNILISSKKNILLVKRYWKSSSFNLNKFYYGWMPPHTSIFFKKKLIPNYDIKYKISGDYDFIIKSFLKKNILIKYCNKNLIIMRTGGDSSKIKYFIKKFKEDIIIYKKYFINSWGFTNIILKILSKIYQYRRYYLISNKYLINFSNVLKFNKYSDNIKTNFIYSAFNLTFFGLTADKIKLNKFNLWPDGIFSKIYNINKIAGYEIYKNLKLNKNLKRIIILGNLNLFMKKEIFKRFNLKIKHINIENVDKINLKYKMLEKIMKTDIIFITLPSPYQEIIANYISEYSRHYKIICFGGALNMFYDQKYFVPKYIRNLNIEFLYRLKTDTYRRAKRLFLSFIMSVYYIVILRRLIIIKRP